VLLSRIDSSPSFCSGGPLGGDACSVEDGDLGGAGFEGLRAPEGRSSAMSSCSNLQLLQDNIFKGVRFRQFG